MAHRFEIARSGGWFDKFTGDGFLAYWIVQPGSPEEYEERFVQTAGDITHTAHTLVDLFHRRVLEDFRSNSRNLSAGVGLSMGLDAGPGCLVKIAGRYPGRGRGAHGYRCGAAAGDRRQRLAWGTPPRRTGWGVRSVGRDRHP